MDARLRALNRFGLGARSGDARAVGDSRRWLRAQLEGSPPVLRAPDLASREAIVEAIRAFREPSRTDREQRQRARRRLVEIAVAEARTALQERVVSERPFVERLVMFWSNHLCVSAAAKALVAPLAGSYEREAIRPRVLGRFDEMVLASAKHPAMLVYLDNFQSTGPNSQAARRTRGGRAPRGLNENYARELLELHTVGVNGGYSQQDVLELAKILTGWTVGGLAGRGAVAVPRAHGRVQPLVRQRERAGEFGFAFQESPHEPGTRTVLGVQYRDSGIAQGEDAIRDLCRHSSTAQFVATKLVTHFVSDNPPAAAVSRIARVFRDSDGDLRVVSRALVDLPGAWSEDTRKFRTPQEWFVAALRAFGVTTVTDMMVGVLRQLRHPLWAPQAPKGFGDSMQEWADPDSLLNRAELARTLARRLGGRQDPRILLDVIDIDDRDPLRTLLSDDSIPAADRIALGIAGPAFQWR